MIKGFYGVYYEENGIKEVVLAVEKPSFLDLFLTR